MHGQPPIHGLSFYNYISKRLRGGGLGRGARRPL